MKKQKVSTFSERLRTGLERAKMKQAELCRATGIDKSNISRYVKGDWQGKAEYVYLIAKALNVSEEWLMGYDVPAERSARLRDLPAPTLTGDYITFPVIGDIAAGYDSIAVEDWDGDVIDIPNSYLKGRDKTEFFVLRVKGDSMFPTYQEGDKVLILKQSTLNYSGQVGAILYDGELATLKRVEFIQGEDWLRMVPINPNHPAKKIEGADLERCEVIGIPKLLLRDIDD